MTKPKPLTKLEPRLAVNRLVVLQGTSVAYDQRFHKGLNIVRGENSSGKSSIADLLFFGLGGDVTSWRTEAMMCSSVFVEVSINETTYTLQRQIAAEARQSMGIFVGSYEAASAAGARGWEVYPYAQLGSKASFSNVLFEAFGMPEVRGALASRVTMHQVLRLMYVDQGTPSSQLFRFDNFDNELTRDVVGSLLCGLYDSEFYDVQVALRAAISELDSINGQIRGEEKLLGENASPAFIEAALKRAHADREKLYEEIKAHEAKKWTAKRADNKHQKEVDELAGLLNEQTKQAMNLRAAREQMQLEIADSDLFLLSLKQHLAALTDSTILRETLGGTSFDLCPACYARLAPPTSQEHCALCKTTLADKTNNEHVARLRNELAQQLAESAVLQRKRETKLQQIETELQVAEAKATQYRLRYASLALSVTPGPDGLLSELNRKIGYLDRQIEDLGRRLQLANSLIELREQATEQAALIQRLQAQKEAHEGQRHGRALSVRSVMSQITLRLLEQDLDREEAFRGAKNVQFDFAKNVVLVDGQANFSASSMVYLKNSFHLALLLASADTPFFRYPRFLLMDNVEDKGMEPARSQNFQKLVAKWSDEATVEHQIIFTTSMIAPELNKAPYTVGDFYTKPNKTLKIVRGN